MKNLSKKLLEKMIDIKKMKYIVIAFWICTSFALLPYMLGMNKPCAMCMIQNSLATFIAALCFFAKWNTKLINIALFFTAFWVLAAIYHAMIVMKIIAMPSFCALNTTFFQKALAACNSSSMWMIGTSLLIAIIVFYLLRRAK